ncbi:MAG: ankyrin repeat domain-containing protein [Gammaproteobacteria bacterium]|nr:ankyrin repeat domain-containing protein [Gammaproteobacteria bacterium]
MNSVEDILKIANWAVTQTRTIIPYCGNLPDRFNQLKHRKLWVSLERREPQNAKEKQFLKEMLNWRLDLSSDVNREDLEKVDYYIETYQDFYSLNDLSKEAQRMTHRSKSAKSKGRTSLESLEKTAKQALKWEVGNCGETSAFAQLLLMEYPAEGLPGLPALQNSVSIERINLKAEDHVFLILNRDPKSDLSNPESWKPDTIICDPWEKKVRTIAMILAELTTPNDLLAFKNRFLSAKNCSPDNLFSIGEVYNRPCHSNHWQNKVNSQKYWCPQKLLEVKNRNNFPENLPIKTRDPFTAVHDSQSMEKVLERLHIETTLGCFSGVFELSDLNDLFQSLADLFIQNKSALEKAIHITFYHLAQSYEVIWHKEAWKVRTQKIFETVPHTEMGLYFYDGLKGVHDKKPFIFTVELQGPEDPDLIALLQPVVTKYSLENISPEHAKAQDSEGVGLLHLAAQGGDLKSVKILIAKGAELLITTTNNMTPLDCALTFDHVHIVEYLLAGYRQRNHPIADSVILSPLRYDDAELLQLFLTHGYYPTLHSIVWEFHHLKDNCLEVFKENGFKFNETIVLDEKAFQDLVAQLAITDFVDMEEVEAMSEGKISIAMERLLDWLMVKCDFEYSKEKLFSVEFLLLNNSSFQKFITTADELKEILVETDLRNFRLLKKEINNVVRYLFYHAVEFLKNGELTVDNLIEMLHFYLDLVKRNPDILPMMFQVKDNQIKILGQLARNFKSGFKIHFNTMMGKLDQDLYWQCLDFANLIGIPQMELNYHIIVWLHAASKDLSVHDYVKNIADFYNGFDYETRTLELHHSIRAAIKKVCVDQNISFAQTFEIYNKLVSPQDEICHNNKRAREDQAPEQNKRYEIINFSHAPARLFSPAVLEPNGDPYRDSGNPYRKIPTL